MQKGKRIIVKYRYLSQYIRKRLKAFVPKKKISEENCKCFLELYLDDLLQPLLSKEERIMYEAIRQGYRRGEAGAAWSPTPLGPYRTLFEDVKAVAASGGGGKGRSYPSTFIALSQYGLRLENLSDLVATSVGGIMLLMLYLEVPFEQTSTILKEMPTNTFQDWEFKKVFQIFGNWGVCSGRSMEAYFKKVILEQTGLNDPSFEDLYNAGYHKNFSIVLTNVSERAMAVFSYEKTPHVKVAKTVASMCKFPLAFEPEWIENREGKPELFTDGAIVENYPWKVLNEKKIPRQERLGFIFAETREDVKKHSRIQNFWHYITAILRMFFLQEHKQLSPKIAERTVKIPTMHSRFSFNADRKAQQELDESGRRGVTTFVKEYTDRIFERSKDFKPKTLKDFLPYLNTKLASVRKKEKHKPKRHHRDKNTASHKPKNKAKIT